MRIRTYASIGGVISNFGAAAPATSDARTRPVVNAVIDARSEFGIREIDMPITREKVWRAIRSAKRG